MLKIKRLNLRGLSIAVFAVVCLLVPTAQAQTEITLKKTFIEKFKNRVTIDTKFSVKHSLKKPHKPASDGDIHCSGTAPEIGLATVAELMNADSKPDIVKALFDGAGGAAIPISGVWRLWSEHGGESIQVQGGTLPPIEDTNPDHVFEIHPITTVNGESMLDTIKNIQGYKPKDALEAFTHYERTRCHLTPKSKTVTISTSMVGFNYVEFVMHLNEDPVSVADGTMVFAAVSEVDEDEEVIVRKRRMVFIKDSAEELKVKQLHKGDTLHVLGIPRISLTLISWRIANAMKKPQVLDWNLPYEIVIVGIIEN